MPKILIVDDDDGFATELVDALVSSGLQAQGACNWTEAMLAMDRQRPDLIILDQWLGRVDTLSKLTKIREATAAPVILLSGHRSEADRIVGLEIGADDFLQKPISTREVIARVRAHLRRGSVVENAGRWRLSSRARRLYRPDGVPVPLTSTEFDLLEHLAQARGDPFTREALSLAILKRPYRFDDRSLDNLAYQVVPRSGRRAAVMSSCRSVVADTAFSGLPNEDLTWDG